MLRSDEAEAEGDSCLEEDQVGLDWDILVAAVDADGAAGNHWAGVGEVVDH